MTEMKAIEDSDQLTEEDEQDFWTGEGHLIFRVLSYDPNIRYCPYEIDWLDYSGCVGGLHETLGIDYAVNEGILDVGKLHIGVTYEVYGITAHFTQGDGWTTDDDVDYYVKHVEKNIYPWFWLKTQWWNLIGWRIRNARTKTGIAFSNYWKSHRDRTNDHSK